MPNDIHAVLLIPAEGDPRGLLHEGPCGARPPRAVQRTDSRVVHEESWDDTTCPCALCSACGQPWPCEAPGRVEREEDVRWVAANRSPLPPTALVLAWEGRVVTEGLDRARHRGVGQHESPYSTPLADLPRIVGAWRRDGEPLGTIVLLDAEGKVTRAE